MLYTITLWINFFFLVAAVWLGVYIVTRSPRSLIAWLTGITLWSGAGVFLNILLALNPPPVPADHSVWARLFFPFWRAGIVPGEQNIWLQGWLVVPALATWHHVTMLLRPGPMNAWRWTRVLLGYLAAALTILILLTTPFMYSSLAGDPLYLNSMQAGALFSFIMMLLALFIVMSLINLLRSARAAPTMMPRQQLIILASATLIAGLVGPIAIAGSALGVPVPMIAISLPLGIAVVLLGYGIARYSAIVDGRTIRRDFVYNAVAMFLIVLVYMGVTYISVQIYDVPPAAFVFVVMLAIVTHSVIDIARRNLDSLFYRQENRQLRANLRRLASLVGEQDLEEVLDLTLASMCASVRATYGLILSCEDDELSQIAAYHWHEGSPSFSPNDLAVDDVLHLEQGHFPAPLNEAALLIPLYAETEQIGGLILGRPVNGIHYPAEDVELLLYPSDQMAESIHNARREADYLAQLNQMTQPREPKPSQRQQKIPVKDVEDALRYLFDYAHLGDTSLAELKLVQARLPADAVTHLDQGKAVHSVLSEAVSKLRPEVGSPGDPAPREWHPYMILHGAYLEDKLNRDIMSRLYISEGTFNRTRRSAIRSVTRVVEEMEAALH